MIGEGRREDAVFRFTAAGGSMCVTLQREEDVNDVAREEPYFILQCNLLPRCYTTCETHKTRTLLATLPLSLTNTCIYISKPESTSIPYTTSLLASHKRYEITMGGNTSKPCYSFSCWDKRSIDIPHDEVLDDLYGSWASYAFFVLLLILIGAVGYLAWAVRQDANERRILRRCEEGAILPEKEMER